MGLAGLTAAGGAALATGCAGRISADGAAGETAQAVAPGIFAFQGTGGVADPGNQGRIGNGGFIVGETGVLVVDPGTSLQHGRARLAAIGATTSQPVRQALVTHTRPEFLFGGGAFRERGIPVAMHLRTAQLMRARCQTCLDTLRETVGAPPLAGTEMYQADRTFESAHAVEGLGRDVRVLYFGHASGPGDIAVLDTASGVLFAGGLLDAARVPDIQDGRLPGWHQALDALRALPLQRIVPGHGPVSPPALIDEVQQYLRDLDQRMRALVRRGGSLMDAPDAADLPAYAAWDQYELIHRRNASIAYLRIEREQMFQ